MVKSRRWTKEEIIFLKDNYYGIGHKELGKKLYRTVSSIRSKACELGICERKKWSEKDSEYLIKNYNKNTLKEIANELNYCYETIFEKTKMLKLKPDYVHRIFPCHEDFFNKKNWSCELAYIVGLMLADGHISKYGGAHWSVAIALCDKDVIYKLKNVTGHKAGIYCRKLRSGKMYCRIEFSGRKIWQFFTELGMDHHKSYSAIWPIGLPNEYASHFLRGVFDGDGCVSFAQGIYPRVNVVGTEKVIKEVGVVFDNYNTIKKCTGKSSWVIWYSGLKAISFLNYIYQGSTEDIRMDRKYNKYLKALKWSRTRRKRFDKSN